MDADDEVNVKYEPLEDDIYEAVTPPTMIIDVKSEVEVEDTKLTYHVVPALPLDSNTTHGVPTLPLDTNTTYDVPSLPLDAKTTRTMKKHACNICSKKFQLYCRLKDHMSKHKASSFECYACSKTFKLIAYLKRHVRLVHTSDEDKMFDCKLCDSKFTVQSHLKLHLNKHAGERFQCTMCSHKRQYESLLATHMVAHSDARPFRCDKCPSTFERKEKLTRHIKSVHNKESPYACTECPKKFTYKEYLLVHMTRHTKENRFVCDKCHECGYKCWNRIEMLNAIDSINVIAPPTPQQTDLETLQMAVFTAEPKESKPPTKIIEHLMYVERNIIANPNVDIEHKQSICDTIYNFCSSWNNLIRNEGRAKPNGVGKQVNVKQHKLTGNSSAFTCNICGKTIAPNYPSVVNTHMRAHESRVNCEVCGKSLNKLSLVRHMQKCVRKKANKFICLVCGNSYKTKKTLNRHSKTHAAVQKLT